MKPGTDISFAKQTRDIHYQLARLKMITKLMWRTPDEQLALSYQKPVALTNTGPLVSSPCPACPWNGTTMHGP